MPKFTKCWYKDCTSDNREDPKLFFYKFPKDLERSEKWVRNCSNDELTSIWNECPDKVAALRICQKHFLREFLGSSSRLVGHAVPAPHGVTLDRLSAERFMVDCANLKSSSTLARQSREPEYQQPQQEQFALTYYDNNNLENNQEMINNYSHPNVDYHAYDDSVQGNYQQPIIHQYHQSQQQTSSGLLMTTNDRTNYHLNDMMSTDSGCHLLGTYRPQADHQMSTVEEISQNHSQYVTSYQPCSNQIQINDNTDLLVYAEDSDRTDQLQAPQISASNQPELIPDTSSGINRSNHHGNPKINYDRDGKVVSIQYPTETLSLMSTGDKEHYEAHVVALKQKVRHYQSRLAVLNHRYQKLKSQMKGRSKRTRLIESLKVCKADFNPSVFEIFERQIKGPSSKQGNRWSDEVKSFSSSIYLRSRGAYRYIRKTIDLPSESIVKRYIVDKKLSKMPNIDLDDEGELELEEKVDDDD